MKFICCCVRSMLLFAALLATNGNHAFAEGVKDTKVSIEVASDPIYPSGDSVNIGFSIKNASDFDITVQSGNTFGLRISIIDPDQKRVTPYPYYPLVAGKNIIYKIKRGESASSRLNLSSLFPFEKIGDYRVFFTKRVYGEGDEPVPYMSEIKGKAIDLEAAPFEFRIESPSKTTLRSMKDAMYGTTPDDKLDGIDDVEWYRKNASVPHENPHSSVKELGAVHGSNVALWTVGCLAVVLLAWLIAKRVKK